MATALSFPRIAACPQCRLGEPEIRGRQTLDELVNWIVWCPTCGAGRNRLPTLSPLRAVESWNQWVEDHERHDPA